MLFKDIQYFKSIEINKLIALDNQQKKGIQKYIRRDLSEFEIVSNKRNWDFTFRLEKDLKHICLLYTIYAKTYRKNSKKYTYQKLGEWRPDTFESDILNKDTLDQLSFVIHKSPINIHQKELFIAFMQIINTETKTLSDCIPDTFKFIESTDCVICHKPLKDAHSKEIGMGKDCLKKYLLKKHQGGDK